ncbi:MAG TPA: hypothetical protein VEL11_07925, partial [Candidatus Bathyarchaeia archaeon]|nr:hypothetical protein [Candidatus Bathyarchaeia archaeon]
ASQMIYSNVKELVGHQQYLFDTLWNKSIASEENIKEIEDGIQPSYMEIVRDSHEFQKLEQKMVTSARDEILVLFSKYRIEEAKNQIHESHNRAFIDGVLIEIDTLNWALNEINHSINHKQFKRASS